MGLMGSLLSSGSVGSFDLREATTTTWRFEVERFGRCASVGSVAGPSTALRFAQDDKFVGYERERSSVARYPTLCKVRKGWGTRSWGLLGRTWLCEDPDLQVREIGGTRWTSTRDCHQFPACSEQVLNIHVRLHTLQLW